MNYYNKHYEFYIFNDNKKLNEKRINKFIYTMLDKYKFNRCLIYVSISRNKDILYITLNKKANKNDHKNISYIINNIMKYLKFYYSNIEFEFYKNKYN